MREDDDWRLKNKSKIFHCPKIYVEFLCIFKSFPVIKNPKYKLSNFFYRPDFHFSFFKFLWNLPWWTSLLQWCSRDQPSEDYSQAGAGVYWRESLTIIIVSVQCSLCWSRMKSNVVMGRVVLIVIGYIVFCPATAQTQIQENMKDYLSKYGYPVQQNQTLALR